MKRFLIGYCLLTTCLLFMQRSIIDETKKPLLIYHADNAGAEIFGKVLEKGRHGKLYTLTIRDYGVFVVTKEVYEKVKIGDEVML